MAKTATTPFDPAKYLTDPVHQDELLRDAFASGNIGYITNALNTVARARGISDLAKATGLTRNGLYKALSPEGDPRLSTLLGVADALGYSLSMQPKGVSPDTMRALGIIPAHAKVVGEKTR